VLDRSLDAFVADDDLERLTLNGFARIRQGARCMTDSPPIRKPPDPGSRARKRRAAPARAGT
jgi:hypothetical protein